MIGMRDAYQVIGLVGNAQSDKLVVKNFVREHFPKYSNASAEKGVQLEPKEKVEFVNKFVLVGVYNGLLSKQEQSTINYGLEDKTLDPDKLLIALSKSIFDDNKPLKPLLNKVLNERLFKMRNTAAKLCKKKINDAAIQALYDVMYCLVNTDSMSKEAANRLLQQVRDGEISPDMALNKLSKASNR